MPVMPPPIAYQPAQMAVEFFGPDQFSTPYGWTYDRDCNVTPVLHGRFWREGEQFDGYAKPFAWADPSEATTMLNEVTGWLLARASGLPVAPRAFFIALNAQELPIYTGPAQLPAADPQGRIVCFATQAVANTAARGIFPTSQLIMEQSAWAHCDQTIAFDEAIANADRHCFNLVRRAAEDFVLIDHGRMLYRDDRLPAYHWEADELDVAASAMFSNRLHGNTYVSLGRTSPAICSQALQRCNDFVHRLTPQAQRALFEISFWCSKLLPGRSAQWLRFLYSRIQSTTLSPLLTRRFGLLYPPHA